MTKTTLEQIVKEGQEEFNKQFPRLEVESFLADFAQKIVEGVRDSVVPEEGIRWMQEGSNKNRKGFTDGFNESRAETLRRLDQFSGGIKDQQTKE